MHVELLALGEELFKVRFLIKEVEKRGECCR